MSNNVKEMAARIAELEAKLADKRKVSVRANPTGTVSVFGIRARFPVSYYPGEWDVIFAQADAIKAACTPDQRKVAETAREAKRNG